MFRTAKRYDISNFLSGEMLKFINQNGQQPEVQIKHPFKKRPHTVYICLNLVTDWVGANGPVNIRWSYLVDKGKIKKTARRFIPQGDLNASF